MPATEASAAPLTSPLPDPAASSDPASLDPASLPDLAAVASRRLAWDDAMAAFLPGMASLERTIATTAEAVLGRPPSRILDLGGGPGRFAERLTARWPTTRITVVDLDPVLLALARTALPPSVTMIAADLTGPSWPALTGDGYHLVTAVMAVHYLDARQIAALYRRAHAVLAPGGVLVVADVMPDPHLPAVMTALASAGPPADACSNWWSTLPGVPGLGPLLSQRAEAFGHPPAEFTADAGWHASAVRAAGFTEAGLIWRESRHAALAAR
ncbi:methyltransferase domain-containing protein [Actinoplanes sp. NPDC023714]|uniref:class I SAM-dependent methyltransferase n=1 Tax=Actinoplanes sp. NPDC023714 TaxID=3154322 RepID=UPI0034082A89